MTNARTRARQIFCLRLIFCTLLIVFSAAFLFTLGEIMIGDDLCQAIAAEQCR